MTELYVILLMVYTMSGEYIATYKSPNYYLTIEQCTADLENQQDEFGQSYADTTGQAINAGALCMGSKQYEEIFLEKAVDGIAL